MGKSARPASRSPRQTSACTIHEGRGILHDDDDLLESPNAFLELRDLAPGTCSRLSVAAMLATTCVGPTAVLLPFAFRMGGFLPTVALTLLFAVVGWASQVRLVQLGISHGVYSLHGLATLAFGSRGTLASAALQLTVSSGLIVTYFALLFQDLPVLLGHALHLALDEDGRPLSSQRKFPQAAEFLRDRVKFAEILTMGVVLTFSLLWVSHPKLKRACLVMVLALFVTCFFVLMNTHALHKRHAPAFSNGQDFLTVPLTIFQSIGILATAFASPRHAFHAFHALQERSLGRFACVASGSALLSLFWALAFGIGGYVSFLSGTRDDVMQNYVLNASASFHWVFWILLPFCAIVGIALEVGVSRHTLQFLTQPRYPVQSSKGDVLFLSQMAPRNYVEPTPSNSKVGKGRATHQNGGCSWWKSSLAATAMLLGLAQIALFTKCKAATVMSVTGVAGGLSLLFVLPAACHLKLTVGDDMEDRGGWLVTSFLPTLSIATGVACIAACVVLAAVQASIEPPV